MKKYIFTKLGRKADPENKAHPMVSTGQTVNGHASRWTEEAVDWEGDETKVTEDFDGTVWEEQEELVPRVGYPMMIRGRGFSNWIRTSCVRSFYIHEDVEGRDKLVLPSNFPIDDIGQLSEMNKGDVLIATMNSIYFAKLEE